jgi:thiol:disulfide interchange protein
LRPHEQLWAYLTLVIAVVLVLLALSSLGLIKRLTLGRAWSGVVATWWQRALASRHPWAPILIGALTFILPCGFTQSMQLYALGSGSAWQAGGLLFMFALGTLPVLLSLGFAASLIKEKFASLAVQRFFGFLILAFALYIFSSAAAMLGWQWPSWSPVAKGQTAAVALDQQVIAMTVDGRGFTPDTFRIKRGVPVRWKIKGVAVTGCTNEIMIPDLGVRKKITNGDNELVFTADQPGRLNFSCWMGMVRGSFIVE